MKQKTVLLSPEMVDLLSELSHVSEFESFLATTILLSPTQLIVNPKTSESLKKLNRLLDCIHKNGV